MIMPSTRQRRRGFTLIEMVIVVGIIVLLAALTITVGSGLRQRGEIGETEGRMKIISMALSTWETARERTVTYGTDGEPTTNPPYRYEIQQTLSGEDATLKLWAIVSRPNDVQTVLAQIRSEYLEEDEIDDPDLGDDTKTYRINDAWDEMILAVFPGRTWVYDDDGLYLRDDDGTIQTPLEQEHGVAVNGVIYFVSAGPDGEFGLMNGTSDELLEIEDNIYTYEVITP